MGKALDLEGKRFGKLTVLRYSRSTKNDGRWWVCKCDCGNLREVPARRLTVKKNNVGSCKICANKNLQKSGRRSSRIQIIKRREKLYNTWINLKQRCYNPNNANYKHYGGRGIRVCEEWLESYSKFKLWATTHGYMDGMTIDRFDNNGNYDPDNCRWITQREQNYNKRTTKYIYYDGLKISIAELVYELGFSYNTFKHYLDSLKERLTKHTKKQIASRKNQPKA